MDPRHESLSQEMLNQFIHLMNNYVRQNTDEVVTHDRLREDMKRMALYIYDYAHMRVDVEAMLSKKNLLSVDIVPLPSVNELTTREKDFATVLRVLEKMLAKSRRESPFYSKAQEILAVHAL